MNVVCPKCCRPVPLVKGEPILKCGQCQLTIDRRKFGLSPSLTGVPLVLDFRGETLSTYKVTDLVGFGGTGVVYKGKSADGEEDVAIKIFYYDLLRKTEFIGRFSGEMESLTRLDHPNIAKVIKYGQSGEFYYQIVEFVDGVNLAHYLNSFKLKPQEAAALMNQIALAVAYAHDQGVVHRNLKPSNVLVKQGGEVKVLDFGLANLVAGDYRQTTPLNAEAARDSFNYMPPELRNPNGAQDQRADVFALGAVFYELLTGNPPIGAFPPPSKVAPGLVPAYDRLVGRCLNPDPAGRPDDAAKMAAELAGLERRRQMSSRSGLRLTLVLLALISIALYLWPHWDTIVNQVGPMVSSFTTGNSQAQSPLPDSSTQTKVLKPQAKPTRVN